MGMHSTNGSMRRARKEWGAAGLRPMAQAHKAGFSLQHHAAVGCALHSMRAILTHASVFLSNTYGTEPQRRVDKMVRALDQLRCRLDSCVFKEYPGLPHAGHIYYPVSPSVIPDLPMTSLEDVCQYLAASAPALWRIADLLLAHYPADLGNRVIKLAQDVGYQAKELPYVVGPPRRQRGPQAQKGADAWQTRV